MSDPHGVVTSGPTTAVPALCAAAQVAAASVTSIASRMPGLDRVGRIVYLAFSPDEQILGFAFPKDLREAMLAAEPDRFVRPRPSDLRYHWLEVRLDAIDHAELTELVLDAWRMVVPESVAATHLGE